MCIQSYVKPELDKDEAVHSIMQHRSGLVMKLFDHNRKKLKSIELVYLPFWCYGYRLVSNTLKDGIKGKVAIEPITNQSAILPVEYPTYPIETVLNTFEVTKEKDPSAAHQVIYWEAFYKEKKREKIDVEINSAWILYMPYWIGYLQSDEIDILAVDAVTGKVDLSIKDALLQHIAHASAI
ncbi:hypothetical protein [Halobacillus naozhouensis]|uniref:Uncharacterized protein n=1 Tax=Halobacillus naozhouensis TaxID=554880 RepID=A0ABY8IYD0_9BACI|nr:hypothetical protein [Halobacillus naozhouensis]WFT74213.1 hypothetical protein P9989_17890 [Halobacillus naozhouensis]